MKIYLGTDHGGYSMKEVVKRYLGELGEEVFDKGTEDPKPTDDYDEFIIAVARAVSADPRGARGIIFGRSGQGEAMLANRLPNVRAAVYYGFEIEIVKKSREHNDANILSLGADHLTEEAACEAVRVFLNTAPLPDEKYTRRIEKAEMLSKSLP